MPKHQVDAVHRYYSFDVESKKSQCKLCGNKLKGRHTTNLKNHLSSKHLLEYSEVININKSNQGSTSTLKPIKELDTTQRDIPHDPLTNEEHDITVSLQFTPPENPVRRKSKHKTLNSSVTVETFQDDDLTAFGNYIMTTLRKLNAMNCVAAQDEIYTVLSKYKLRQLANCDAASGPTTQSARAKSESSSSQDEDVW